MDRTHVNTGLCEMSAKLFVLSNKRGYRSTDFIEKLMKSELAIHLYNKDFSNLWLGETYVMSLLESETKIESGDTLSDDFMYWTGYLFRVWSLTYDETPEEMLEQAPVELLEGLFLGLHVMSYEMAIQDIKELYHSND